MERNDFFKAIKENTLSGAYLLHGEEEYVKESALRSLLATVDETVRDMNTDNIAQANAAQIIAACETIPFLCARRIVIVRALPKDADAETLKSYINRIPPETVLLFFIRGDADGRLAFVKALVAQGRAVLFAPLSESEAARWIRQQASSSGIIISQPDAEFFASYAGTDCANLAQEFRKTADYVGEGNEVTKDVIKKVVTRDLDYIVFAVLDQIMSNHAREGFTALRSLMYDGEAPMEIASRIGEKARLILQARRLIERKTPKDAAIKLLGVSSGYGYRVYEAARLMSPSQREPLARCAKALCDVTTEQLTGRAKAVDSLERALIILAG